jgi:hypothetical protein
MQNADALLVFGIAGCQLPTITVNSAYTPLCCARGMPGDDRETRNHRQYFVEYTGRRPWLLAKQPGLFRACFEINRCSVGIVCVSLHIICARAQTAFLSLVEALLSVPA